MVAECLQVYLGCFVSWNVKLISGSLSKVTAIEDSKCFSSPTSVKDVNQFEMLHCFSLA